jgi:hypothetical protein
MKFLSWLNRSPLPPPPEEKVSLRDQFAMAALPAIVYATMTDDAAARAAILSGRAADHALAFAAYRVADAMLNERDD